ncbi:4'-phosphopantetheinyl transferase family protein [Streptomyces sp. NPDC054834]
MKRPAPYGTAALPAPGSGAPDEPRLWLIDPSAVDDPVDVLDTAERARLHGFVRERDRARYRAAHLALRRLLGACLDVPPREVALTRAPCRECGGPHGRPVVAADGTRPVPYFSLAYAGDLALAAVAAAPVGVDVEDVPSPRTAAEAAGSLHPRERAELRALPPSARPTAFARCWARKEACLKGTGLGLAQGGAEPYVGCGARAAAPPGWAVHDVEAGAGRAAAVAVLRHATIPGSCGALPES